MGDRGKSIEEAREHCLAVAIEVLGFLMVRSRWGYLYISTTNILKIFSHAECVNTKF